MIFAFNAAPNTDTTYLLRYPTFVKQHNAPSSSKDVNNKTLSLRSQRSFENVGDCAGWKNQQSHFQGTFRSFEYPSNVWNRPGPDKCKLWEIGHVTEPRNWPTYCYNDTEKALDNAISGSCKYAVDRLAEQHESLNFFCLDSLPFIQAKVPKRDYYKMILDIFQAKIVVKNSLGEQSHALGEVSNLAHSFFVCFDHHNNES